jgi:hypothetical protein
VLFWLRGALVDLAGGHRVRAEIAPYANVGMFGLMGEAAIQAVSLADAFEYIARYVRVVHQGITVEIDVNDRSFTTVYRLSGSAGTASSGAAAAAMLWAKLAMYHRHRSCFRRAAALFDPPIEPVSIPYENGKTLPGYFMRASATGGPGPTVMILGGGDSTCEELYYFGGGAAAVRRGYNAFLWEGPGQVGAFALDLSLTYRPDWEVPTRYAVDYVLSRDDVDPKRLALSGLSMGGYFARRAAA